VGGSAVEFAEVASDALQTAVNKGAEEYQDNTQEFANFVREQAIKLRDTAAMPSADRLDLQGRHILWVDDKPVNNAFERAIMERSGATVSLATSTEEALQKVRLLGELQTLSITTPFIIYTGSESPEQIAEAKRRGAFGLTKSPQQLLGLVSSAVQNTRDA
jgi:hypothetical protein